MEKGGKKMVFSSAVFLFCFLPAVFLLYRLPFGSRYRNALLAAASLVFYAFGQLHYVPLFLLSVLINYLAGLFLSGRCRHNRPVLAIAVILNLGILAVFKYTDFLLSNLNALTGASLPMPGLELPIGISFFTFQGLSYTIDTYRDPEAGTRDFGKLLLYISFFPQLIAGPIVRWGDISAQINNRTCTVGNTACGIRRFLIGLAKKLLLADSVGYLADAVFSAGPGDFRLAWLGGICYTLQIYFDFSGYSDMAIGMGRMFGFVIKENFLFPYTASSMREFWRKWHVSLSSWFREYLYFPLGGSRVGTARAALNRFLVFFCTGLWHGANWTFVVWGLGHGLLTVLEGSGILPVDRLQRSKTGRLLCRLYTLLAVMLLFTIFRADSLTQGFRMIAAMFSFRTVPEALPLLAHLLSPASVVLTVFALLFSGSIGKKLRKVLVDEPASPLVVNCLSLLLLILCICSLAQGGFHPFIYFQF